MWIAVIVLAIGLAVVILFFSNSLQWSMWDRHLLLYLIQDDNGQFGLPGDVVKFPTSSLRHQHETLKKVVLGSNDEAVKKALRNMTTQDWKNLCAVAFTEKDTEHLGEDILLVLFQAFVNTHQLTGWFATTVRRRWYVLPWRLRAIASLLLKVGVPLLVASVIAVIFRSQFGSPTGFAVLCVLLALGLSVILLERDTGLFKR